MIIETNSEKETYELGFKMGQSAKTGQVYTLVGDLGVGKTVFTKGLAAGLGIEEPVSSPTFTIVQIYEEGRLPFYHFDVYRIGDVEEMDEIGYEDYIYGEGVSLIEWANLIEEILPEHYTEIKIEKDLETLNAEKEAIEQALSSGNISVEQITEMSKRLPVINDTIDEKEMRWLELSELEA